MKLRLPLWSVSNSSKQCLQLTCASVAALRPVRSWGSNVSVTTNTDSKKADISR